MAQREEIRDLTTDPLTRDFVVESGDLTGTNGLDSIRQDVSSACAFAKGEAFLDLDVGVDYFGVIFRKGVTAEVIRSEFSREIAARDGVVSVDRVSVEIEAAARHAYVEFEATADEGLLSGFSKVEVS